MRATYFVLLDRVSWRRRTQWVICSTHQMSLPFVSQVFLWNQTNRHTTENGISIVYWDASMCLLPPPRQCLMHKWARCIRLIFDVRWESLFSVYIALCTSRNHVCATLKVTQQEFWSRFLKQCDCGVWTVLQKKRGLSVLFVAELCGKMVLSD